MNWIDFTNCTEIYKGYDGADTKKAVIYNDNLYMLKFPKKTISNKQTSLRASYSNNPFSEYIGCQIFSSIGIEAQNTLIGKYGDKVVVACEDFVEGLDGDILFQEFSQLENSFIDSDDLENSRTPRLESLNKIFGGHPLLRGIREDVIKRYWDTFVVDSLVGNFDRHSGNWGYFVNKFTGETELAPVYDCGSCLYPNIDDEHLPSIRSSEDEMQKRIYGFPQATLKVDDKKVSYFEFINGLENDDCNSAILRVVPNINLAQIESLIADTPLMSEDRKDFLSDIVKRRYEIILSPAFDKLKEQEVTKGHDVTFDVDDPEYKNKCDMTREENA